MMHNVFEAIARRGASRVQGRSGGGGCGCSEPVQNQNAQVLHEVEFVTTKSQPVRLLVCLWLLAERATTTNVNQISVQFQFNIGTKEGPKTMIGKSAQETHPRLTPHCCKK